MHSNLKWEDNIDFCYEFYFRAFHGNDAIWYNQQWSVQVTEHVTIHDLIACVKFFVMMFISIK